MGLDWSMNDWKSMVPNSKFQVVQFFGRVGENERHLTRIYFQTGWGINASKARMLEVLS